MHTHKTLELKDPGHTRQINTIPVPYQKSLTKGQLFTANGPDHKLLQKFLKREGLLSKVLFLELVAKAKHIFSIDVSHTSLRTQYYQN